ncbi:MAG TPA: hypothetical protein VH815_00420 [Acidobacteriota bacterium]|jgi:hypothetical protein
MNDIPEYLTKILDFIFRFGTYLFWLAALVFVAATFLRRKSSYQKMQKAAMALGLEFDGNPYAKQIQARTESIQQQTQDSPKILQVVTRTLDIILPLFYFWEMKGRWNGVPVRVYSEKGKSNSGRYTVVRADTEATRTIGLQISTERFLSTLGNKDITIGNEELDKLIYVKADDAEQAKIILMSPTLQDALLQAFKFSKYMNVQDQYVSFYEAGNLQNEETLRTALDHVSRTAQALRSAGR